MIRQGLFTIIFSCVLLVACRGETGPAATPTPFPSLTAVSAAAPAGVQPITLTELMAEPSMFRHENIEVTGQFYRLPRLTCGSATTAYRPPASFTLREGEIVVYGGGIGSVRDVVPDGLTMTVNGRLLSWHGPVGCGKRAIIQEIWYIEVNRVVAPRPVTSATLTPVVIAAVSDEETALPTATPTLDQPEPDSTPTPTPDQLEPDSTPTPTPDLPEPDSTPTPTATPTPEEDDDNGDDGDNGDESDEGATATPTATLIPRAEKSVIIQSELSSGNLAGSRLEVGEIHEWQFTLQAADVLTVSAIANQGNLKLYLLHEEDTLLAEQDEAPSQEVETIASLTLPQPGDYRLQVEITDDVTADYHLLFMLSDSYTFVMRGLLEDGVAQSNISLAIETDHSWHFAGEAGDQVQILITPQDNMDPFFRLYGPDGEPVEDENGNDIFVDTGDAGEPESLLFTLPESGLYAIHVGDFAFIAGTYTIVVRNE